MTGISAASRLRQNDVIRKVYSIYGIQEDDDSERSTFLLKHIEELERAQKEVVARSGFVLRRAYEGYGLGYRVPIAIIAIGQSLLGIDLAIAAPAITSNPIAMTCAAVGAVYYGYSALSDAEREAILTKVAGAMNFGIELLRSVVDFCISTLRSLMDGQSLAALKSYVADVAGSFGVTIADITGSVRDRVSTLAAQTYDGASFLASNAKGAIDAKVGSLWNTGKSKE